MYIKFLGMSFYSQYYLHSDFYIPQRTVDKFKRTSNSLMENGLHKFYSQILYGFKKSKPKDASETHAIKKKEFYFPMAMCFYYLLFAVSIFIIEICRRPRAP